MRTLLDQHAATPPTTPGLNSDDVERIANRVVDMLGQVVRDQTHPVWLSSEEVATRAGMHAKTVTTALLDGELHGHRLNGRGRWRVHTAAVDAWVVGADQWAACGCPSASPGPHRRG